MRKPVVRMAQLFSEDSFSMIQFQLQRCKQLVLMFCFATEEAQPRPCREAFQQFLARLSTSLSPQVASSHNLRSRHHAMTGRGPLGNPQMRCPSPIDPTLESRPVPRAHRFPIRSFGPGAAADVQQTLSSLEDLEPGSATINQIDVSLIDN
jgi:hypothetical protein